MAGSSVNWYGGKGGTVKGKFYVSTATLAANGYTPGLLRAALVDGSVSAADIAKMAKESPQPAGQAKPKFASTTGKATTATGPDPNKSYALTTRLMSLSDMVASNTGTGAVNPAYPADYQPRDRSRDASQAQIATMAAQLNPDALIADIGRIDAGSPIVDENGAVLSGNGRTLALQQATPATIAAYKARLKELAPSLGIDPAAIDQMQGIPVLVRQIDSTTDPIAFARDANSSGTLRMSPLEQAAVDANTLSDASVLLLHVGDSNIDAALRSSANQPFVDAFLKMVPSNERANLLTKNGTLNQLGLYRAKAALFTRAFPGDAGARLAESMLESLDPDLKNVQTGISGALPAISRAVSMISAGDRAPYLDISADFAKAIDMLARIRDNTDITAGIPSSQWVGKYLDQGSLFGRELTPDQERLLVYIDSISRKPTAVKDMFNTWAKLVDSAPDPNQIDMFGGGIKSASDLITKIISGSSADSTVTQASLL
jgi:hypothetical protein